MDNKSFLFVGVWKRTELRADDRAFSQTIDGGGTRGLQDLDLIDGAVAGPKTRSVQCDLLASEWSL